MTQVHEEIPLRPYQMNSQTPGSIKIASYDKDQFCNLFFKGSATVHPDDMRKLRDALNILYPVPFTSQAVLVKEVPVRDENACIAARREGFDLAEALYKPKPTKAGEWEVVADGLDRIKVKGGYIYQTADGAITFAPNSK